MKTLLNDLRYGAKMLWKSKGVTIVAVISLAIGIGANSAIFSLVNSILLRPRPVSHPEQLVEIYVGEGEQHPYPTTSYPSYRRTARSQRSALTDSPPTAFSSSSSVTRTRSSRSGAKQYRETTSMS